MSERGRLQEDARRDGVGILTNAVYAFDGAEYRELEERWEYSLRQGIDAQAIEAALRGPPRIAQGRIEAEAGEYSTLRRAQTPLRWADYWFLVCAANAGQEQIEPKTAPLEGRPGVWQVTFDSKHPEWGHTCRAWIDQGQGSHVIRIDLRSEGRWIGRYEAEYAERDGRWLPTSGVYLQLAPAAHEQPMTLGFTVQRMALGERWSGAELLPPFPQGTLVGDLRTQATYRVGQEDTSDERMRFLTDEARAEHALLLAARTRRAGGKAQFAIAVKYVLAGVLTGFVGGGVGFALVRRLAR